MIKKISLKVFATVACLFIAFATQAQNDRPVKFGFDLGLGYANQWGNAYDAYHKTGLFSFTFGADIDIRVSEKQFIEVGANFNRKGCKIEGHQWVKDGGPWKFYTDKTNPPSICSIFKFPLCMVCACRLNTKCHGN